MATSRVFSRARPVPSTSGDHTSCTVTYFSCFAFAFPNRAGFRRTTVAAPLRSAASPPPGTRLPLLLSLGTIHFHSQKRPRIKCHFQPIKKKLPQTFGGASTSTNDLQVFSSASFFEGRGQPQRWPICSGKMYSGTAEPTNHVRGLQGGAILIGNPVRKRAGPRERALRFDWQA